MPIVFSAIVPHPPVLVPEIGKDNLEKIAKTADALVELEQALYAAKPESLVVIAPSEKILDDAFNINFNPNYTATFKKFGDFTVEFKYRSDYLTIQEIRAGDESHTQVPIVLTSEEELGHEFSVPLFALTSHLKDLPVIPITYSKLDAAQHFAFGQFLHRELSKIDKRFAVIASADLSNKLTKDAPGGFSEKGVLYDRTITKLLEDHDVQKIVSFDEALAQESGEYGLRAIQIFLGVIATLNVAPKVLSYEAPFGVGYVVVNYEFK